MTAGKRVIDRTWKGASYCGSQTTFGERITKTWSGADTPKARPSYTNVYDLTSPKRRKAWVKPVKRATKRPENSYSMSLMRVNDPPMRMKIGKPQVWQSGSVRTCYGGGSYWPTDPITANDKNDLISKLREAIVHSDFNIGVFLAEGNQALTMIADTGIKLARAGRLLKRGRPDLAWRQLMQTPGPVPRAVRRMNTKDLAGNVLELRYGWLPLLNDLYEASKLLEHLLGAPMVKSYRVAIQRQGPLPTAQYPDYRWLYGKNTARRQIIARISEVNIAHLTGLTDPASVLWEKLPWSFVGDWVIPIGSYLSARGVASSLTGTFITSHKWHRAAGKPSAIGEWTISAPSFVEELVNFDRIVSTNLIVARPTVKPLGKIATWVHAQNAMALVRQAWK